MDFYTLDTTVDLEQAGVLDAIYATVGFFTQTLIQGMPHTEGNTHFLRFAVRVNSLTNNEAALLDALYLLDWGFTSKNTKLVRAERL